LHENDIINIYPITQEKNNRADDYSKLQKMKPRTLDEKTIKVKGNTISVQNSGIINPHYLRNSSDNEVGRRIVDFKKGRPFHGSERMTSFQGWFWHP
jgi:hypothetical protein